MTYWFDRFHNWMFKHSCQLELLRHKTFVFYCIIRILYSLTSGLLIFKEPKYFKIFLPSIILSFFTNTLAIFLSRYNLKKTCQFHLIFCFIILTYYLFMIKTNITSNSLTPFIYMGMAIVATFILGRTTGFIFFISSILVIGLSMTPLSHVHFNRIEGPNLFTIDIMIMNGIYMAYTFLFISYFATQLFKYYNYYLTEVEKTSIVNTQLLTSNKTLSDLNGAMEAHIVALEEANAKLQRYAWVNNHEVRAPLATLMGLTYLLESGFCNEKDQLQTLAYIKKTCIELDEVIKGLNITLGTREDLI